MKHLPYESQVKPPTWESLQPNVYVESHKHPIHFLCSSLICLLWPLPSSTQSLNKTVVVFSEPLGVQMDAHCGPLLLLWVAEALSLCCILRQVLFCFLNEGKKDDKVCVTFVLYVCNL